MSAPLFWKTSIPKQRHPYCMMSSHECKLGRTMALLQVILPKFTFCVCSSNMCSLKGKDQHPQMQAGSPGSIFGTSYTADFVMMSCEVGWFENKEF